jgi:SGNH hydrolase-like domain, acetyltransferase AlgX
VASLVTYVLTRWSKFEGQIVHGKAIYDDNAPTFTDDAYLKLEFRRSNIFLRGNRSFEVLFSAALSYISEIKRVCDRRRIGLTIVLIPDELQVSEPLQTRVIARSGLSQAAFDFLLPNRLLRASFEELKIDYVDLITEFSAHSLDDRLYRRNDSHWNIAGNELAAQLILQHVSAQLVDGP